MNKNNENFFKVEDEFYDDEIDLQEGLKDFAKKGISLLAKKVQPDGIASKIAKTDLGGGVLNLPKRYTNMLNRSANAIPGPATPATSKIGAAASKVKNVIKNIATDDVYQKADGSIQRARAGGYLNDTIKKSGDGVKIGSEINRHLRAAGKGALAVGAIAGADKLAGGHPVDSTINAVKSVGHSISSAAKAGAAGIDTITKGAELASRNVDAALTTSKRNELNSQLRNAKTPEEKARIQAQLDKLPAQDKSIVQKAKDTVDTVATKAVEVGKGAVDAAKNTTTGERLAAGGVAVAAGVLAAKIVSDVNQKLKWKVDGCAKLAGEEKSKCMEFVAKKKNQELSNQLSRCKYANNPEKCEKEVRAAMKG